MVLCTVKAQLLGDTTFFDRNEKELNVKDSAAYYRLVFKEVDLYKIEERYINHQLQMTGTCTSIKPEVKEGLFIWYAEEGNKIRETFYVNNKEQGKSLKYHPDGSVFLEENFQEGKRHGELKKYYPNGQIRRLEQYENDEMKKGKCFDSNGKKVKYFPMEQMPEFKGGLDALYKYISKNVMYPTHLREKGIHGKVIVKFVVWKDGTIKNVEISKGHHPDLNEEAMRVVRSMPNWEPGRQEGEPVNVYFHLPISFNLR